MNSRELPDALKPYAQVIEVFGWNRFIPRYELASPEKQEKWRMAIWEAAQGIQRMAQELDIDEDTAAKLFHEITYPLQGDQEQDSREGDTVA